MSLFVFDTGAARVCLLCLFVHVCVMGALVRNFGLLCLYGRIRVLHVDILANPSDFPRRLPFFIALFRCPPGVTFLQRI